MRRAGVRVVSLIAGAIVGAACGGSDSITEDRTVNRPAPASIETTRVGADVVARRVDHRQ